MLPETSGHHPAASTQAAKLHVSHLETNDRRANNTEVGQTIQSSIAPRHPSRFRWRVVDIVVAAVLAVAVGVLFWVWGIPYAGISGPVQALLPGIQGILNGPWLLAGPLVGLIVRKPGAALFAELVAALVEALLGSQWGVGTLYSGVLQGAGAEVVLAIVLYRSSALPVALLAGAGAGVGESVVDLISYYPGAGTAFALTYSVSTIISGAIVGGVGGWLLLRGLARTGALSRFASARTGRDI